MKAPPWILVLIAALLVGSGYLLGRVSKEAPADRRVIPNSVNHEVSEGARKSSAGGRAKSPGQDTAPARLLRSEISSKMHEALAKTDRLQRLGAVSRVLAAMTPSNVHEILQAVMERYQAGFSMSEELELIHYREGQVIGKEGRMIMPAEPNGKVIEPTKNKIKGWASVDPGAAREWLETLEPGKARDTLMAKWVEGLAGAAPETIEGIIDTLPPAQQRSLVGGLLNGLQGQGGFAAMRDWFDSREKEVPPEVKEEAFKGIMWRMGQSLTEWDQAVNLFMDNPGDGLGNAGNFNALTRNIAPTEPGRCLDLIARLSEKWPGAGVQLDSMIRQTIEQSSITGLSTVGTWLNENKNHPLYDRSVHQFAIRTKQDDAEAAMRWAETIKEPSLRALTISALTPR